MRDDRTPRPLIVYQAPWNWDHFWNRAQPLATALSAHATVVYVDSWGSGHSKWHKARHYLFPGTEQLGKNIYRLRLEQIARFGIVYGHANNNDYSRRGYHLLKRALGAHFRHHRERWLMISRPTLKGYGAVTDWSGVLVDIEDPWLDLPWAKNIDHAYLQTLLRSADWVFANGSRIADRMSQFSGRDVINLPNGIAPADLSRFERLAAPPDWMHVGEQESTVVFAGQIDGRLDLQALSELTARLPQRRFVFIGSAEFRTEAAAACWNQMRERPNVVHIPRVHHQEIPSIVSAAGVLIIPYAHEGAELMFPAKLWEYLAAQRPICTSVDYTTDVAALKQLASYRVCRSLEDWTAALSEFGRPGYQLTPDEQTQRREICLANQWQQRATEIISRIKETQTARGATPRA